jgi:hypothetical protein
MKRANPVQLRQALEVANTLVRYGINFVCMPVVDEADGANLLDQASERLERMALITELAERAATPVKPCEPVIRRVLNERVINAAEIWKS